MTSKLIFPSKSRVDKAGETLKAKVAKKDDVDRSLKVLSRWRAYHAAPLSSHAKTLKKRAKNITSADEVFVAQRLKRTPSILLKLQTHKTMRLSAMQDIGGLRAILSNVKEVYQLADFYRYAKKQHILTSFDDYIEKPKVDGYRGIHLVYKLNKSPSLFLEIQIRSHLQHIWATGVEVFSTLKNSSFKSGQGDDLWLEFFAYLSSVFAIKEKYPLSIEHKSLSTSKILKKTKFMIKKLKAIEQLNFYTELYKAETILPKKGRTGDYSLIVLNSKNNTITIKNYSTKDIDSATEKYLDLEKDYYRDQNINVVLVNSGNYRKLKLSYPNYFMDTQLLTQKLSQIILDKFLDA